MDKEILTTLITMLIYTWMFLALSVFIVCMKISTIKSDMKELIRDESRDIKDLIREENRNIDKESHKKHLEIMKELWKK